MTQLYIIRHAEAEGNLYRRIHGWYDSLVTERGCRQIAALEHRFQDVPIDAVYSSDLFRTRTTAAAIHKPKGLPLITRPGLREVHLGVWEDRTWGEVGYFDPDGLRRFNSDSPDFLVEGGETFFEAQRRITTEVRAIAAAHPGAAVAVFSHGTAIRMLQAAVLGLPMGELKVLGHSDNTAVSCIEAEGDKLRLVFANDNSHLPEEISTLASQGWWKGKTGGNDGELRFLPLDMERQGEVYYNARKEAWVSIHGGLMSFDGEGFLREAQDQWWKDRRAVTCAYLRDELVGLIQLDTARYADESVGYIPFYYMMPKYRKQGLGVQLLGEAVSVYRPMGRTRLRLRCAPDNAVAQRFYGRYGFTKVGEAEGTRVPLDLMEKEIAVN